MSEGTTTVDTTAVAEVWREVLGVEVGPRDDFFTLGGHSLLAMAVVATLRKRFGVAVRVRMLLEHPICEDFARRVGG